MQTCYTLLFLVEFSFLKLLGFTNKGFLRAPSKFSDLYCSLFLLFLLKKPKKQQLFHIGESTSEESQPTVRTTTTWSPRLLTWRGRWRLGVTADAVVLIIWNRSVIDTTDPPITKLQVQVRGGPMQTQDTGSRPTTRMLMWDTLNKTAGRVKKTPDLHSVNRVPFWSRPSCFYMPLK